MELNENIELFNKPIIREENYLCSNHKIFKKYSSIPYQKYSFELLETLLKKSNFENKSKIFHKSIYFLLKFLYKTKNNIFISNFDILILISFDLGIKTSENQKKIPNLTKLKNIYKEKFGKYKNEELQKAEVIFIKVLEYKINFITAYDYLCFLFQNNIEYIKYHKKSLEVIIKEKTFDYCTKSPISIIQECIQKVEKNKLLRYPIQVKKKLIQQQKKNLVFKELSKNIDESLSTSISSGHYNNNLSNELRTINNNNHNHYHKENEKISPIDKIISKYVDISVEKINEEYINNFKYCFSDEKSNNNITINSINMDYDRIFDNMTYSRKNIKNIIKGKSFRKTINDKKILFCNTNFKEKLFQRNHIPVCKLRLNFTNNNSIYENSPRKIYLKPHLKKEESKGYFTTNKKSGTEKFNYFNKYNRNHLESEDFKLSLKKKLLFD